MRVFTTACLAGVLTAAAAHAGLPPVFQRYLKMFDGDYQRLSPEFSKAGVDQGTKDRYLQRLENHLKKVPKNYHSEADVKSRLDKVAALKGGGGAAPAAADAGGMSDPDRARKFQADYQKLYNDMRATRGQAAWSDPVRVGDFRKRLASLKTLSDGFQDPSQGYVKQSLKNYQSLSDWLDRGGAAVEKAEDDATAKADAAKSGGATSGGAATPATKPGAPLDFQSKRMIGFFDKDHYRYQAWFEGPLEAKKVADYKAALAKLENWYSKIPPAGQAHPEGQKRKAVVEAIRSKIDSELGDVKILPDADKQLLGQFKSLYQRNSFKIDGAASNPLSLQDPAEKARIEKLLAMVREPLDKVSMKDHPDVKKQMARLKPLEEALAKGVAQGAAMADEAGDIDAQIAMMKKTFPYRTFDPRFPGGDAEAVAAWAERLKAWEEGAEEGYAWLEKVEKLTLAAKEQDSKDYKSWFRAGPGRAIKNAKDEVVKGWFSKSRAALMNVNPNIGNMSKSAATATANRLESVVPDLERLIAYQRVYEGKVDEEFSGGKKKIEDVVAKIRGDVATRAGRARMPEARGAQGQELLTIARETLGREKYGVGEIRGLRIRSGKESSTRVEYWDGKWWTKDWDEFHVAFAAKDGGKWFIKYADIRFYRKGFRTTPTGKWIVAKMFGDREILEENIGK